MSVPRHFNAHDSTEWILYHQRSNRHKLHKQKARQLIIRFSGILLAIVIIYALAFIPGFLFLHYTPNSESSKQLSIKTSLTDTDYVIISNFLEFNDVEHISAIDIQENDTNDIQGDRLSALLNRAIVDSGSNKIALRLTSQSLRGLPHNTLIQLPTGLVILDHLTSDSVYLYDSLETPVTIKPYQSFNDMYVANAATAYVLVDRGYSLW